MNANNINPEGMKAQAEKSYQRKRYAEAAAQFKATADAFQAIGDSVKVAEMYSNRSVALLMAENAGEALEAAEYALEILERQTSEDRSPDETRRLALVLGNQAGALEALNRLEDALTVYRRANELLREIDDTEHRPALLKSISKLQLRTGHQLEGLASMESALDQEKHLSRTEKFLKKIIKIPLDQIRRG